MRNDYSYAVTLLREDGSTVVQTPLVVDWEPAREWTRFQAVRRAALNAGSVGLSAAVEPVWNATAGAPYIQGFRMVVGMREAGEAACEFPNAYFDGLIRHEVSRMVEQGTLRSDEHCRYLLSAFPREAASEAATVAFTAEEVDAHVPLRDGVLAEFVRKSAVRGEPSAEDVAVFLPDAVLRETAQLARDAGAKETGGILIGHLYGDARRPDMFAEVTAQIHARDAEADLTRLSFTAETWTSVRAALALRRQDEVMLGWWHSHPVREWCKECPPERQRECRLASDFFSAHDRALHRAVFPRAYNVGLVVNEVPDGEATFSLFGWRLGLLEPRGFYLTGVEQEASGGELEQIRGGPDAA